MSVNGNTISDDPILIYHDEIEFGPSPPTVDTIKGMQLNGNHVDGKVLQKINMHLLEYPEEYGR